MRAREWPASRRRGVIMKCTKAVEVGADESQRSRLSCECTTIPSYNVLCKMQPVGVSLGKATRLNLASCESSSEKARDDPYPYSLPLARHSNEPGESHSVR